MMTDNENMEIEENPIETEEPAVEEESNESRGANDLERSGLEDRLQGIDERSGALDGLELENLSGLSREESGDDGEAPVQLRSAGDEESDPTREETVTANITAVETKYGEEAWEQIYAVCLKDISVSTAMLVDAESDSST